MILKIFLESINRLWIGFEPISQSRSAKSCLRITHQVCKKKADFCSKAYKRFCWFLRFFYDFFDKNDVWCSLVIHYFITQNPGYFWFHVQKALFFWSFLWGACSFMGKNFIILPFLNIFLQFTLILGISCYFTDLNFSITLNNNTAVNIQLFSWQFCQGFVLQVRLQIHIISRHSNFGFKYCCLNVIRPSKTR